MHGLAIQCLRTDDDLNNILRFEKVRYWVGRAARAREFFFHLPEPKSSVPSFWVEKGTGLLQLPYRGW